LKKQAAVYRGQLAAVPQNSRFNSRSKLYEKSKDRFVAAKVVNFDKTANAVEIVLEE
jgi:hypothetical protein